MLVFGEVLCKLSTTPSPAPKLIVRKMTSAADWMANLPWPTSQQKNSGATPLSITKRNELSLSRWNIKFCDVSLAKKLWNRSFTNLKMPENWKKHSKYLRYKKQVLLCPQVLKSSQKNFQFPGLRISEGSLHDGTPFPKGVGKTSEETRETSCRPTNSV